MTIAVFSIDRLGRRVTALRSCFFVSITLAALAALFACAAKEVQAGTNHAVNVAFVVLIMLYLIAFGSGLSGVAWVVVSEIYPMRVRAVGVGQAIFFNWMCNYAVAQSFLSLVDAISYAGTFAIYLGISIVGGCLLYRYLPETMGHNLEGLEAFFHDPYTPPGGGVPGLFRGWPSLRSPGTPSEASSLLARTDGSAVYTEA